jgi:cysteinyl-tRNA synthetase
MYAKIEPNIHIYDTMARRKERFEPLVPGKVTMYVCGPTVYDLIHIGNARPLIFFDVVRRYLQQFYDVTYAVNFTDVDDKLIRRAEETGRAVPELAEQNIADFLTDAQSLKVPPATVHPRVTENMTEIIDFIADLVHRGFAYENGGDVYFRTSSFPGYGKLSHQNLDELQFGTRIAVDERKESPLDFVLWKAAKPGEISWTSPWGEGRPGWHIECSAMARKYLGDTIDIHGGGMDLTFPHHECEIAQSESATGKPFARYWMHNAFLNLNNEKMSKSIGNVVNARELAAKHKPETIRFLMLSTHYRNPLNFTDEGLEQAKGGLERIENCRTNLKHLLKTAEGDATDDDASGRLDGIRATFHAGRDYGRLRARRGSECGHGGRGRVSRRDAAPDRRAVSRNGCDSGHTDGSGRRRVARRRDRASYRRADGSAQVAQLRARGRNPRHAVGARHRARGYAARHSMEAKVGY